MWRWVTEYRRVVWRGCAAGWSLVIGAREWWSIVGAEVSMCRICCPGRPPDGARPGRSSVLRGLYPQRITHMAKSRGGLPRDGGGGWAGDILKRRFKFDRLNFYCATFSSPGLAHLDPQLFASQAGWCAHLGAPAVASSPRWTKSWWAASHQEPEEEPEDETPQWELWFTFYKS